MGGIIKIILAGLRPHGTECFKSQAVKVNHRNVHLLPHTSDTVCMSLQQIIPALFVPNRNPAHRGNKHRYSAQPPGFHYIAANIGRKLIIGL